MQKLELFDETFDPYRIESYQLSVQVSLNGFSFCVMDVVRNQYIALVAIPFDFPVNNTDEWPSKLQGVVSSYPWLSGDFKKVLFCYESPTNTIVPKEYFEPDKAQLLLKTIHPIDPLDEIWYNDFQNELVSIFNIPSTLITGWLKIQKRTKAYAFAHPALCFHQFSSESRGNATITLTLTPKFSVVIASEPSKLLHCGSFEAQTSEDIVYHLMNIAQALKIPTNSTDIKLLGDISPWEHLELLIGRFFLSGKQASTLNQNHFSYLLQKHRGKYANLFNLTLCE
ncbi:MAG TPA: DUF3822 family protein [Tenuifilaceae bacterium]|nr:DUF3822 family protein [Tenuifilaceae bacterium]